MTKLSEYLAGLKSRLAGDPEAQSAIAAAVKRLGVRDPKNPSAKDFKLLFDAYLKDKTLDTGVFNTYVKSLTVPLKAMFDGFAQFSADSRDVSKRTMDIIERAMDVLEAELKRENISDGERQAALDNVLRMVAEARDESERERFFRGRLAMGAIGTVVIVGGIGLYVVTRGRKPELLQKGIEMAGRAAVKAV